MRWIWATRGRRENDVQCASFRRTSESQIRTVTAEGSAIDFRIEVRMARAGIEIETTDEASGKHATDRIEWTEIVPSLQVE